MKVLLVNGSPRPNGNTAAALREMEQVFAQEGVETELVHVGGQAIRGCIGCGKCREKGRCVFDDLVNETAPKFAACDGLVAGGPVYYASANATLVAFLTRLFYSAGFDKTMKVGASVVAARRGGLSAAFDELNKFFTISGLRTVLEQRPRRGPRRGGGRPGGDAVHAHPGPEHGVPDAGHRPGQGEIRPAGAGEPAEDEFYSVK